MLIHSISVFSSAFPGRSGSRILATDTGARNYSILQTPPGPINQ